MAGVIRIEHVLAMKDGAIPANLGTSMSRSTWPRCARRPWPPAHHAIVWSSIACRNGKVLDLLAEGRLVGQVAAEASPAAVMDMSFADQALKHGLSV